MFDSPSQLPITNYQSPFRPTSPDALADAVRQAAATNTQLRITGTNSLPLTTFDLACPVQTLSTLRMNKVLDHAVSDMTVSVHAGISLEALQKHLAWQNQWLPVDPPIITQNSELRTQHSRSPGTRTLGGLIASNSLGPLRFSHLAGDWRRLILGIRWIDAAGTLLKSGGQTVKNVAGYPAHRMLIGSCASLGIIAEVTLRTFARPADEQSIFFFPRDAAHAEQLLAAIFTAPATPAYVQIIAPRTFAANPLQLPANPGAGPVLVAGFMGRPETCAHQIQILRDLPPAQGLESIAQPAAPSGRFRLWLTSEPAIDPAHHDALGIRLHAPSSQLAHLLTAIESHAQTVWLVAEAQGILRGTLRAPDPRALLQQLAPNSPLLITQGPAPAPQTPTPSPPASNKPSTPTTSSASPPPDRR